MDESDSLPAKRVLTEELINRVDKWSDSPSVRASDVWARVAGAGYTDWDIICFASEALGLLSERYPYLRAQTVTLSRLIYSAHYFYPQNFNARVGATEPPHSDERFEQRSTESEGDSKGADAPRRLISRDSESSEATLHVPNTGTRESGAATPDYDHEC